MTRIGYARVSTDDQTTALQLDALKAAGCDRIFEDQAQSGARSIRPGLAACLKTLQAGDTLTVWRLDRLGRSISHLIETLTGLKARGIQFQSLTEAIDTTTPTGNLIFHVLAALAEFERALLIERTRAGLQAARKRGVKLGRRYSLSGENIENARKLLALNIPPKEVARTLKVGKSTLYRALNRQEGTPCQSR